MNKHAVLFVLLSTLLCACTNPSYQVLKDPNGTVENNEDKLNTPYVVMISLDGFRHDYIEKFNPPFLSTIVDKGIRAKQITPVFPSLTFPNHYTLVTGQYAGNHDLVSNRFKEPSWQQSYSIGNSETTTDGKWYGGNPLWLAVREQGVLSASFFWVGSDANINGHYPNYYVPYDGSVKYQARTQQILDWLSLPEKQRPHFLTLYFSETDHAGHDYGPDSKETKDAVLLVDKLVSDLVDDVAKLNLPVNFVIVSDHGMKAIENAKRVYLKEYVDTSKANFHERGAVTSIYLKDKTQIQAYKAQLNKVPYTKAYLREELPERYQLKQNPRAGDIILLAEPGAYIYPLKDVPQTREYTEATTGATHGYDPYTTPEMGGIFLSFGPHVKNDGLIEAIDNIHVFPYVMALLKLNPVTDIDGDLKVLKPHIKRNKPTRAGNRKS